MRIVMYLTDYSEKKDSSGEIVSKNYNLRSAPTAAENLTWSTAPSANLNFIVSIPAGATDLIGDSFYVDISQKTT